MHVVNQCIHGITVSQCRCPNRNKSVKLVDCPDTCKGREEMSTNSESPQGPTNTDPNTPRK